jgi:hypothetical protein
VREKVNESVREKEREEREMLLGDRQMRQTERKMKKI